MSEPNRSGESWGTRLGVILAVMGSAVGLGNFLRFPGLAAQYGGGAFIIPYAVAFLLLGLPIAWVEWAMGRRGGRDGYNSLPGVFRSIWKNKAAPYFGVLGLIIPVMIYMYYVYIEAWCLGYAVRYLTGQMDLGDDPAKYDAAFGAFVGADADASVFASPFQSALVFLLICFILNFILIYRGLNKGIEWFCKWAMPALIVCALIVLVRVLTLGTPNPDKPDQSLVNGLGYMWNPEHQAQNLAPGDKSIQALVVRSTKAAARVQIDGDRVAAVELVDPAAFAWALERSGWARSKGESATEGTGQNPPSLEGDWEHSGSKSIVRVTGNSVTLLNAKGEPPMAKPADAALADLLALLPRDVADIRSDGEASFDSLSIQDADGFGAALKAMKWSTDGGADGGAIWTHQDSRLSIHIQQDVARIEAPGFWQTLSNPEIWLAAAGQIFFSLSVGFGIIITYASYLKSNDDVALSSVTASAGNGFCEVALGGLITIPATFVFLGVSAVANPPGTFGMGFVALPNVFNAMPAGQLFGFLFFFLLFLAAVTSSLSMLQPAIAFLEEGLGLNRKASVSLLGFVTAIGCGFVLYFSHGFTALDTIDFWVGTFCIYILATIQVILFAWVQGIDEGMAELDRGAEMRIPRIVKPIIKYVAPIYLLIIFGFWVVQNAPGRLAAIVDGKKPAIGFSVALIALVAVLFLLLVAQAARRWNERDASQAKEASP